MKSITRLFLALIIFTLVSISSVVPASAMHDGITNEPTCMPTLSQYRVRNNDPAFADAQSTQGPGGTGGEANIGDDSSNEIDRDGVIAKLKINELGRECANQGKSQKICDKILAQLVEDAVQAGTAFYASEHPAEDALKLFRNWASYEQVYNPSGFLPPCSGDVFMNEPHDEQIGPDGQAPSPL